MRVRVIVTAVAAASLVAGTFGVEAGGAADREPEPLYNEPTADAGPIEEVTTLVGPISLDAMGGAHWQDEVNDAIPKPAIDVPGVDWYAIRGASFDVVDAEGTPVPRHDVHLHHFVLAHVGQVDPACPSRQVKGFNVRPHLGSGSERTPIALPEPYAFKLWDDAIWAASWHVMNMTAQPKEVYLKYTIAYQPGRTNANTRWVDPWFLDVDSACGAVFDVPGDGGPGSVFEISRSWTVQPPAGTVPAPTEGLVVGTGGHLHDGGIATELRGGDGALICRSEADYGGHDPSHGMPIDVIWPCATHHPIEAGEQLTLHALYDNSQPYDDVMGINLTFLWWGDQAEGVAQFPDVGADHPFLGAVTWAVAKGITTGYADGRFQPTNVLTRQAMTSFIWKMSGSPAPVGGDSGFSDVDGSHPFHAAITWAAEQGLVNGYPDGTFRGGNKVSRQALVAFLWRMADEPVPTGGDSGFSDVDGTHPFHAAITWAAEQGLVNGYADGTFRPAGSVTRQAGVAILSRAAADSYLDGLWDLFIELWDWVGGGGGHAH